MLRVTESPFLVFLLAMVCELSLALSIAAATKRALKCIRSQEKLLCSAIYIVFSVFTQTTYSHWCTACGKDSRDNAGRCNTNMILILLVENHRRQNFTENYYYFSFSSSLLTMPSIHCYHATQKLCFLIVFC